MDWVKNMSLKRAFFTIIIVFLMVSIIVGILFYSFCDIVIEHFDLYVAVPTEENISNNISSEQLNNAALVITGEENDKILSIHYTYQVKPGYEIISFLQMIMPIVFLIIALISADIVFYQIKLKQPLLILRNSAERIQKQDLDFEIKGYVSDEFGELCSVFDFMRQTLLSNNRELWRQVEERKRLNAAFSHDLRNPITVLEGAAKLLKKNLEHCNINYKDAEKSVELIEQYTDRIKKYVEVMTSVQKLEELECKPQVYESENIQTELVSILSILAKDSDKEIRISNTGAGGLIRIDKQFVYGTVENLIGNALRYANKVITVEIIYEKTQVELRIIDDGKGFSNTLLQKGITPFQRDQYVSSEHFGMGLYVCKLMCEKHGGSLKIQNLENGANVIAIFK